MKLFLIRVLFLLPSFSILMFSLWFAAINYADFIDYLQNARPEIYEPENIAFAITKHRFEFSQFLFSGIAFCLLLLSFYAVRNPERVTGKLIVGFQECLVLIKKLFTPISCLDPFRKFVLLTTVTAILFHKIFFLHKIPFQPDEIFSYVFFVKQDFWISCIYYPEPNNHIFFNLICNFLDVFISDPKLCMRLPSLIFFFLSMTFIFLFSNRHFGFTVAMATLILVGFSESIAFYAVQGRGYMAMCFFSLTAAMAAYEYVLRPRRVFLGIFMLASIAGAYTIPAFLFPFGGILLFALIKRRQFLSPILIVASFAGIFILLLYTPLIGLSGIEALTGNKWVKPDDWEYLSDIFPIATAESIDYVLGSAKRGYLWCFGFAAGLLFLWVKCRLTIAEKNWLILLGSALCSVLLLIILLRHFPPYRVWTYLVFFTMPCLAFISIALIKHLFNSSLLRTIIICILITSYSGWTIWRFGPDRVKQADYSLLDRQVTDIYKTKPGSIFIEEHDLAELWLRLKYIQEKGHTDIDVVFRDPEKEYDYMIIYDDAPPGINMENYQKISDFENSAVFKRSSF